MKRALEKYRNSAIRIFIQKYEKFAAPTFFVGGFIFDSLTLGRIDRLYDLIVLCLYMTLLTLTLFVYNLADDGKWENTIIERYETYLPLAIQFFFGGLSSAYVIYFSRSVSFSKTISFFVILVLLLFANEFLKKRISNKYLQFSVYFFVSFTFFTFMMPVFIKEMNTTVFIFSGVVSLIVTLLLIIFIYSRSPSTRAELDLRRMIAVVILLYSIINVFYFLKLIPPVPLALQSGIVAHNVEVEGQEYRVTYEMNEWYIFWRKHSLKFMHAPGENVYVFASIFAPTDIKKSILHRWKWYNPLTDEWEIADDIGYEINGGRDEGYRGYTFKSNVKEGAWKVEVITSEELVIGVIDFQIVMRSDREPPLRLVERAY